MQGKLLVVRYSGGDDIVILTPNGPGGNVPANGSEVGNPGLTGFRDPLDLVEHTTTGNLYVTELGAKKITLLKPRTPPTGTSPAPTATTVHSSSTTDCDRAAYSNSNNLAAHGDGDTGAYCRAAHLRF